MEKKYILPLTALFFCFLVTFKQDLKAQSLTGGPSYTLGLNSVLYEQGKLDAGVIAGIIATKKEEIRSEMAKRMMLSRLQGGNFAVWNFASQNLEVLFKENNADVIRKEILINAAELMLVYGIAEYYLQYLAKKCREDPNSLKIEEQRFLLEYMDWLDEEGRGKFLGYLFPNKIDTNKIKEIVNNFAATINGINCNREKERLYDTLCYRLYHSDSIRKGSNKIPADTGFWNNFKNRCILRSLYYDGASNFKKDTSTLSIKGINMPIEGDDGILPRPEILSLTNKSKDFTEHTKNGNISSQHILIDMVYDICRRNRQIKELGLFADNNISKQSYEYQNQYKYFLEQSKNGNNSGNLSIEYFAGVEKKIDTIVDFTFKNLNLLSTFLSGQVSANHTLKSRVSYRIIEQINALNTLTKNNDSLLLVSLTTTPNQTSHTITGTVSGMTFTGRNQGGKSTITLNILDTSKVKGPIVINQLSTPTTILGNNSIVTITVTSTNVVNKTIFSIVYTTPGIKKQIIDTNNLRKNIVPDTVIFEYSKVLRGKLQSIDSILMLTFSGYTLSEEDKKLVKRLKEMSYERTRMEESPNNYAYELKNELLPRIMQLHVASGGKFEALYTHFKYISILVDVIGLQKMYGSGFIRQNGSDTTTLQGLKYFWQLLTYLNNLEKIETYDYIFKYISSIGSIYNSNTSRTVVTALAGAYDKYATLNKEDNKIKLDVESMTVDMYDRFAKNTTSRISPHFTVGINNMVPLHRHTFNSNFGFNDTSYVYNISYVAEKIGVKIKLMDWNKKRSFGEEQYNSTKKKCKIAKRELNYNKATRLNYTYQNPIVSNFHLLVYASGILYQIEVLRTEKQFKSPIVGASFGLTFFNGLDFNVGAAMPVHYNTGDVWDNLVFSSGFDIQIFEYISELRRKSKRNN